MKSTWHHRTLCFLLVCFVSLQAMGQFADDFSDGDYTRNPEWVGDYSVFAVNSWQQLQTKAIGAAESFLSTLCRVNHDAVWRFWCRITTSPTAYNYLRFYLTSTTENPLLGEGWYVQIGGTNKNITLRRQTSGNQQVLIENGLRKKLLVSSDNRIEIEVQLSSENGFVLRSRVEGIDDDFVEEGRIRIGRVGKSGYCGIVVNNTAQTGACYYVDNISVAGTVKEEDDTEEPEHETLLLNEIMFDPAEGGQEYIEIYNPTDQEQSLAYVGITTLNNEGTFSNVNVFPHTATVLPYGYAVLCKDAANLILYHNITGSSDIFSCGWGKKLNNSGATLCLMSNRSGDWIVLDSVHYLPQWHHPLLLDTKGVALERIHPDLPTAEQTTWHSASKESGYATPGSQNSQYRDVFADEMEKSDYVYLQQSSFSPNGDGFEDQCLIHYEMPANGFVANIRVFTPTGVLLYALPQNGLLELSGTLVWDGRNLRGSVADMGVYVLMCEFTNALTGQILRKKLPVVVSAR